jgi:Flp pilus assembly pilin Flp
MIMKLHINAKRSRKGAALVEYGLLVAGVAVVALAAVAVLGNKVGDLFATSAAVLPGAHQGDNAPIATGQVANTGLNANGQITVQTDPGQLTTIGENLGLQPEQLGELVVDQSNQGAGLGAGGGGN